MLIFDLLALSDAALQCCSLRQCANMASRKLRELRNGGEGKAMWGRGVGKGGGGGGGGGEGCVLQRHDENHVQEELVNV